MEKDQLRAPSSESLEAGYETSTVSIKGLAWFVIVLILVAAVIHAGTWFLLKEYVRIDERKDRPFSALTDERAIEQYNREHGAKLAVATPPPPPPPQIQPTPPEHNLPADDLRKMRESEDETFRRMGWIVDDRRRPPMLTPPQVVSAVIREETRRQQQEKQSK